jgi:hypothetical protein
MCRHARSCERVAYCIANRLERACVGFRQLAHTVGPDEPLPAPDAIVQPFNDAEPFQCHSLLRCGLLASFGAQRYPGTKRWYGTSGNSFVAVVEFGNKVRAKAVIAGGESGHPESTHFDDEVTEFADAICVSVTFIRKS